MATDNTRPDGQRSGTSETSEASGKANAIVGMLGKYPYIPGIAIGLFIGLFYLPTLGTYLMSDDFEWLNSTYAAWSNPSELFTLINHFFRPLVKLGYLLNYTLFGGEVFYYNVTTVLMHLVNIFLVYWFLFKLTERVGVSVLVAFTYGASALYSEVPLWAAGRPESMVMIFMLAALILLHDLPDDPRPRWRWVGILIFTLCAAGTKETWVLLPLLSVFMFWLTKPVNLMKAVELSLVLLVLVGLFVGYFIGLPMLTGSTAPTSYATAGPGPAMQKFAFLMFKYTGLDSVFTGATWQLVLAPLVVIGLAYHLIRRRNRIALYGLFWMLLTIGISLPIQHAPSRYNYLPLVGFWILVVAWLEADLKHLVRRFKINPRMVGLLMGAVVMTYAAQQLIMLQWEIKDYRLRGATHKELVDMYLMVKDRLPHDRPIVFVDLGRRRAVDELVSSVKGYRKLLFVRQSAIWQQVFLAPLANFAGRPFEKMLKTVPDGEISGILEGDFTALVFNDTGFYISADYKTNVREYYRKNGKLPYKVQVLRFESLKGGDQR